VSLYDKITKQETERNKKKRRKQEDPQVKGPLDIDGIFNIRMQRKKERNNNKPNLPIRALGLVEHTLTDDCQQSTGLARPIIITIMAARVEE
jgi:hypothetical protein